MMTHRAIAQRFKAGESVAKIAGSLGGKLDWFKDRNVAANIIASEKYVEHAIRQVLRRQHAGRNGRR